ncbi:MAG: hypothetical protein HZA50_02180 [Planctomycetes bacterium]|nr:hypothetical protein [Planctomycetota bacterium]
MIVFACRNYKHDAPDGALNPPADFPSGLFFHKSLSAGDFYSTGRAENAASGSNFRKKLPFSGQSGGKKPIWAAHIKSLASAARITLGGREALPAAA